MPDIIRHRMTAQIEGDFCIFLIGMRVNNWLRPHKWLPPFMAMPRMVKELYANPQLGFLGAESAFGNPTIMVQYWKSFAALEAYARDATREHFPAWVAFNKRVATTAEVGIWHETFLVHAGEYESIYNNIPPFGLGKVGKLVPASGARESAAGRIGSGAGY